MLYAHKRRRTFVAGLAARNAPLDGVLLLFSSDSVYLFVVELMSIFQMKRLCLFVRHLGIAYGADQRRRAVVQADVIFESHF